MTNYLALAPVVENPTNGSAQISWPGTSGNYLTFSGGEWILRNRGSDYSYSNSLGTQTISFGTSLYAGALTDTSPRAVLSSFDGPYALIAPGSIDFTDPNFHGTIEWYGYIGYAPDPQTGEYPVYIFSGPPMIHGQHVVNGAISLEHHHPSSVATGHFTGGGARVDPNYSGGSLYLSTNVANGVVEFVTDDGSGDAGTAAGGPVGAFVIAASGSVQAGQDVGYVCGPMIGGPGQSGYAATFPSSGIARSMISFCHYFPGVANVPSVISTGGSFPNNSVYCVRWCYYKSLTLQSQTNHATITAGGTQGTTTVTLGSVTGILSGTLVTLLGGMSETLTVDHVSGNVVTFTSPIAQTGHVKAGWGSYTQTIETPLSTPADVTISTGTNTNAIQLTIPAPPSGWDGVHLYVCSNSWAQGYSYSLQAQGTDYTVSGTTYTLTQATLSSARNSPSFGFAAWPSGTYLAKDPTAAQYYLMKWAHIDKAVDTITGLYQVLSYHPGTIQLQTKDLGKGAVQQNNLKVTNPSLAVANAPLMSDGSGNLKFGTASSSGGSNITNGGVVFSLDQWGHVVITGGVSPQMTSFNSSLFQSASFSGPLPVDFRGQITVVTKSGVTIPVGTTICTVTFASSYPSAGLPWVQAMTTGTQTYGILAAISNSTISFFNAVQQTTTGLITLKWNWLILA